VASIAGVASAGPWVIDWPQALTVRHVNASSTILAGFGQRE
jgi:RIO-like serine/threonine protein kinase